MLSSYKANTNLIFKNTYANVLLNLEVQYADEVIEWLLDNPKQKFKLGNDNKEPIWKLAGKLIEKFSPHCSQTNFEKLENTIFYFHPDDNLEWIKRNLEYTRENYYIPYWGQTQYHLLPKLDYSRITIKSEQLIAVLNRKFEKYTEDDFCNGSRSWGGVITSPIKKSISNAAWKKLITSDPNKFKGNRFNKDCTEASIEQFSNTFREAVIREPARFAEFALPLPIDIHQDYIDALYWGLRENDIKRVPDELKEEWEPCPTELIEKVIDHFSISKGFVAQTFKS